MNKQTEIEQLKELLIDEHSLADDKLWPRLMKGDHYGYEIRVTNLPEFLAKIQALIDTACVEARVDELNKVVAHKNNHNGVWLQKDMNYVDDRLKELKGDN